MEPLTQPPANYEFRTSIMWFRRDLRVDDNPALVAALTASAQVIPVFIWAPEEEGQFQPGRCSRWWTKHSLVDLQQALAALGSRLIIRRSTDSTAALLKIVAEVGAEAVFFNHLYDPISLMRDHDCKRGLASAGVAHRTFNGDMLYEPWEILDINKQPFSTFEGYWNSIRTMPVPPPFPMPAPVAMPPVPADVASLTVIEVDWYFTAEQEASSDQLKFKWKPGVGGAIAELERFCGERLHIFEHDRAKVDRDSTSRLSPWMHIGSISVRYIFYRVRQCQAEWLAAGADRTRSCDDFLQQVGYREYSRYLSFHFPFIHERSLLRHLRACPWRIDQHAFKAWRQGQTGYPIVDAAMRQLWSSGWCHNRARVVAASFLVKDLLLPWQWGLKHYWDAQIDADLECDALGWQYVSGGMSDAHPFSYMMDLESEARRFDPDGEYVRRWLPVLSRLPTQYIHAPWKAPPQVLAAADVELGCNYPAPIVSREGARANVEYACAVLEKSAAPQAGESSGGKYPYRAPTFPLAVPGAGASSGANPTGVAGATGAGPSSGTAAGHASGGAATRDITGPSPHAHRNPSMHAGNTADGAEGGQSGQGPRRDSSGAADGAQFVSGSAPVSQACGTGMAPPPPVAMRLSSGLGPAAPPGVPGGAVYYHPGDAAGHQMLESILQQQRRTRAAAARHQDGSGTNRPPPHSQRQPRNQAAAAPGDVAGDVQDAAAAAAAWAGRVESGDADDEAVGLWQQQQMLPGGTAAYAFEQAMQLLLARRRMGDGVSAISGDEDGRGPGAFALDDADSEEVVSNTVNLNVTAFTGASCHGANAGTARGARKRGRAAAAAAAAAAGALGRAGGAEGRGHMRGDGEELQEVDDDETASPSERSPQRSGGDEADPVASRRRPGPDGPRGSGDGEGCSEDNLDAGGNGVDGDGDEEMECSGEAEAGDADGGSSPDQVRTPQGGLGDMAEDGSGGPSEGNGPGVDAQKHSYPHDQPAARPHRRYHGGDVNQAGAEDRMADSPPPSQHLHVHQLQHGGAGEAARASPRDPCDLEQEQARGDLGDDDEMAAVGSPPPQQHGMGPGLGLHKRRRSESEPLDCD